MTSPSQTTLPCVPHRGCHAFRPSSDSLTRPRAPDSLPDSTSRTCSGDGGETNKSWYLRAASSEQTTEWFRRIEEAGAHATDTVHETARAGNFFSKRSQLSYRANK